MAEREYSLTGTRVFGDSFVPEDYSKRLDLFLQEARVFGPVLIVSQEKYKYLQELRLYVERRKTTDESDINIALSETEGPQSPADMCNQIIVSCQKRGLGYFGVVSNDLARFIPSVMPEMIDRLSHQPDLTTVGVAVQNVHNLELLEKIREHGMGELTVGNYATLFHNNAFAVHRLVIPCKDGSVERLFSRDTDQGKLGMIQVDGQDTPVGGNEEIALVLKLLKQGISLNTQLLAGKYTIIRDPKAEISSVDRKILRRPQVAKAYQEHYGVTDEQLIDYLKKHYQIVFE